MTPTPKLVFEAAQYAQMKQGPPVCRMTAFLPRSAHQAGARISHPVQDGSVAVVRYISNVRRNSLVWPDSGGFIVVLPSNMYHVIFGLRSRFDRSHSSCFETYVHRSRV